MKPSHACFKKGTNPIDVGTFSSLKTLSMVQLYSHLRSKNEVAKFGSVEALVKSK